ncbi:MAG: cupin [Rhodospirillaceae bacterium]|nr:cupin [Rhodospirillaceae bacterium]|tara:strand:+ start:1781 stop:2371 length:591 start_codon:yes stop_codon:yes gene_type:complete
MSEQPSFVCDIERQRSRSKVTADFYAQALEASKTFKKEYAQRKGVVKANEMPMERTSDGLIKHIINEGMNTAECCIDIYMQFIPSNGATGTSRHLSEEIAFVIEGTGHDLHYDVRFQCEDEFIWEWDTTPKKYEWGPGDYIYIPPYCAHKRVNSSLDTEARVVVINSRLLKPMGFHWFDQLEPAKGFEDLWIPPTE